MGATIRTFLISTLVVLLGILGNYWSNKYALQSPTIFYSVEKNDVNEKSSLFISVTNSSNIVIDSLRFNTGIKNLIGIEFGGVRNNNLSLDSTKWAGSLFPNESLLILAFYNNKGNSSVENEIKSYLSGKYRNNKNYQWENIAIKNGIPGFRIFLTSIFWYALPFFIVLIIFLLFWGLIKIRNKKKHIKTTSA